MFFSSFVPATGGVERCRLKKRMNIALQYRIISTVAIATRESASFA